MGRKGCCMILSLLCVWMLCDTAIAAEYLIPGGQVIGIELEDAAITQEIEKMLADGFLSRHSTKIIADYEKRLANMDVDIHQLSVKQEELSNALLEVYEAYTRHCTTKDEFKNQSEHLSMEHTDCEIKVQALIAEKGRCKEQLGKFIRLISALREYQESRTLTRELIEVFVERISIFPQQRIELVLVVPELAASLR